MNIYITGDLHGNSTRIHNFYDNNIKNTIKENEENWIICLGDFGALYYLDSRDNNFKERLHKYPFKYFVIRGNHEQRASICQKTHPINWEEKTVFDNKVLVEKKYPNIYYALDGGGIYNINNYKTLVLPGAYSVDKYYRLQNGAKWFENELLTESEMNEIEKKIIGQQFDFILTHTCPISWEPTDLFLGSVNQSTVDKSMEIWMDRIKDKIKWQIWCFGHFHADRLERPHVEMFFRDTELLANVWQRWEKYRETGELDWWLERSPNFYMYEVN